MSPARIEETIQEPTDFFEPKPANKAIFHDGFKTSGQQAPIYSLVQPYENFPKEITGPTVWKAEEFRANPERWTHHFTEEEVAEINSAADRFIESGIPLTGITKVFFELAMLQTRRSNV